MTTYIFDLGGVLINLDVERCMHAFEHLMGEANMRAVLGMDSQGEGVKAVSVASKQLMADFERGLITPETFVSEIMHYCRPGTTEQDILSAWMSMLADLPLERLSFIDRLREAGHPVYLLSNGNDLHFNFINQTYSLEQHFDGLFLSQKMHLSKPEKAIFEAVQRTLLSTSPALTEQVVFIDDIASNRKAAETFVNWKTFPSIEALVEHHRTRLTRLFHKACADYQLIEDGDHILIGLSGGKDSLLLTELLGRRSKIYKPRFQVTALHVRVKERDYQTDLSYLESFCQQTGVPLIVRDVEIGENPTNKSGLSGTKSAGLSAQRSVSANGLSAQRSQTNPCFLCAWYRRKTLFNVAQELGCTKIAFGHHRDDVVQTLLMNLIYQGAFATMPPSLQMEKMPLRIIRPLCLIDEEDIRSYAAMQNYAKQSKNCPFEHVSAREKVKDLLAQIKALNPEAMDCIWASMSNIKEQYLPQMIK